ncbi:hypothetical protein BWI96_21035 [Siphonobacter sp. SORGH_AS_0500]|uniref:nucleoside deaminase n=1 Tax=Siphonobacter sp. SORGH_AS_0500 TaxID=1864824 RepID=UPI000CAD3A81|nr:nucleoside deaminase [Siphonobacter sp. SORGH_AS_0500]PKK34710.1 hypothetical protein BWI96_21035 [Siphonobacter sp. SORGH_AS_0500]
MKSNATEHVMNLKKHKPSYNLTFTIKRFAYIACLMYLMGMTHSLKTYATHLGKPKIQPDSLSIQDERDHIFSLLAYALVYQDWQGEQVPREKRRGYNIGALLVNEQNEPLAYNLNCITSTNNSTQHAEIRMITKYLEGSHQYNLRNCTVYTTLEPCAMCAGMILMTATKRVVYGQHDIEFSKAFERLAADHRASGGLGPYPRTVQVSPSSIPLCQQLDRQYETFLQSDAEKVLAKFLASESAKSIYQSAHPLLEQFNVLHPENIGIKRVALAFYQKILHSIDK